MSGVVWGVGAVLSIGTIVHGACECVCEWCGVVGVRGGVCVLNIGTT